MRTCKHDPAHIIPDDAHPDRVYCSGACRVANLRARRAKFAEAASSLLLRQTAAIQHGDHAALVEIERETAVLFSTAK
jgi:hypothetical protein